LPREGGEPVFAREIVAIKELTLVDETSKG